MQATYSTNTPRIGKVKGAILKHVMPKEIIGKVGVSMKEEIPPNSSDTIVFRRWLPKGATVNSPNQWTVDAAAHQLVEGETPVGEVVTPQDLTTTLVEYGFIYRWTNRVEELYEDEVPPAIKKIAGGRIGLLMEMIRYGQLKAGTNVFRAGNVASRSLISGLISANMLRNIARSLGNNLAERVTEVLEASDKVGTQPIEASYIVVHHVNLTSDIRSQLSGFVHVSEYGTRRTVHPDELGSWEEFRFIPSPHTEPYLNAGTTAGANTRLAGGVPNSTGAELVDVYPVIVLTEQCYGDVMLRGKKSMDIKVHRAGESSKEDVLGQRGVMGIRTYFSCLRLNDGHMAVGEVAASSL